MIKIEIKPEATKRKKLVTGTEDKLFASKLTGLNYTRLWEKPLNTN
jgi:hypothetical protein